MNSISIALSGAARAAAGPVRMPSFVRGLAAGLVCLVASVCSAETVAPVGCPIFHCTAGATGVMNEALVPRVLQINNNNALGTMKAQGCSGNGSVLACLFATDTATGTARGTLKLLNATTLQPIWGSAAATNSYNLDPKTAAIGQVPTVFADGLIAAGDSQFEVIYNASGAVVGKVPMDGQAKNFGLTPISDTYAIVSQADGFLTLINMSTWQAVDTLRLSDPITGIGVGLASPSTGANGVLYVIAANPAHGVLYSVTMNTNTNKLVVRGSFVFGGVTVSGFSPVVVPPSASGLQANLILMHAPSLLTDPTPTNHLVVLKDTGSNLNILWTIAVPQPLTYSPSVDVTSQTLLFGYANDAHLYQYKFLSGNLVNTFDMRAVGNFPSTFVLDGHLGAMQSGSSYTMLLSGSISNTPPINCTGNFSQACNGQYMLTFSPDVQPAALSWVARTSTNPDAYTGAWNIAPSSQVGFYCPVIMGSNNGLTRVCDF